MSTRGVAAEQVEDDAADHGITTRLHDASSSSTESSVEKGDGQSLSPRSQPSTTTEEIMPVVSEKPTSDARPADEPVTPRWDSYSDRMHPMIIETAKEIFQYERVTKVQQTIFDMMPIKKDLLVRSRTGTGKTLAFLVPALQRAMDHFEEKGLKGNTLKEYGKRNASTVIISPTRELANQIASEARRLMTVHGSNMKALCVVGGDDKKAQLKVMLRERNDFVVGTPGRMLDLLENEERFADLMRGTRTLILDEADTLLEMGFRPELEQLMSHLPKDRQTYMFSATMSRDIRQISKAYLKPDHLFINTVPANEPDSHQLIKQQYIIRPMIEHVRIVLSLIISQQLKNPAAKVIVFLQTTKMTQFYATIFKYLRRLYPVITFQQFDIHAQRSQDSRTKVSAAFRTANAGSVLFTTDVSARGVDYPGVSLVIQVGSANSRDLYIHRIGRTGRAGKDGEAILILQPIEKQFLRDLGRDIPIKEMDFPDSEIALGPAQQKLFNLTYRSTHPELVAEAFTTTAGNLLGRTRELRISKASIAEAMSPFFEQWAPDFEVPSLDRSGRGSDRSRRSSSSESYALSKYDDRGRGRYDNDSDPRGSIQSGGGGYNSSHATDTRYPSQQESRFDVRFKTIKKGDRQRREEVEYRPRRPSEIVQGRKRKNFRPGATGDLSKRRD